MKIQVRSKQALRAAAAGALLALIGAQAQAAPPTPRPERSLVGVSLSASFSDVLRKFGQPTEIQVGNPVVSAAAQPGGAQGGGMGMGSMAGGPSGMSGSMPGMPSGIPPSMMGNYQAAMQGSGRMPGGAGLPGFAGGKEGGGASLPGFPGGGSFPGSSGSFPGMSGSFPGGGRFPGMGANMGGAGGSAVTGNETTWWYHFPKQGLHYSFLFDRKGHVIQIQAYGYKPASGIVAPRTAEGITLGASLADVIRRYGWSSDGDHSGDYVVLRYGAPDQIAFQSRHNQVIGIVLGIVKR